MCNKRHCLVEDHAQVGMLIYVFQMWIKSSITLQSDTFV